MDEPERVTPEVVQEGEGGAAMRIDGQRPSRGEVVVREAGALQERSANEIGERLKKILTLQKANMIKGVDYGVIPGTERKDATGKDVSKPTLLKAGAEKLNVLFMLDPQFKTDLVFLADGQHLAVSTYCTIYHQISRARLGGATAFCTSKESKYAWRKAELTCPNCGKQNVRKSKHGEEWYCWTRTGGCGATFPISDRAITEQKVGRVPNEDVADTFPTIVRMAEKRALIAATRLVTGASAVFDEEIPDREVGTAEEEAGETAEGAPDPKDATAGKTKRTRRTAPAQSQPPPPEDGESAPPAAETPKQSRASSLSDAQVQELEDLFMQVKFASDDERKRYRSLLYRQFGVGDKGFGAFTVGQYNAAKNVLSVKIRAQQAAK